MSRVTNPNAMKPFLSALTLALLASPAPAQHYITLGTGLATTIYRDNGFDQFKDTYNFVNAGALRSAMRGFGSADGLRYEVGYRRLTRLSLALLLGIQNFKQDDVAEFQNGELRRLKLKTRSFFIESEVGIRRGRLFLNGLLSLFFKRKITLDSDYIQPGTPERNPLNGTFKGDISLATDLGVSVGIVKEPLIIAAKITYPMYTGGKSNFLSDPDPQKIADGFELFPSNFRDFFEGFTYEGVSSDIDGIKVAITVAVAVSLGGQKQD